MVGNAQSGNNFTHSGNELVEYRKSSLDELIGQAAHVIAGNKAMDAMGDDGQFVTVPDPDHPGRTIQRSTFSQSEEEKRTATEIKEKVEELTKKYHLSPEEQKDLVNAYITDAYAGQRDRFRMGPNKSHEVQDFIANLEAHPTPEDRRKYEAKIDASLKGTQLDPNPETRGNAAPRMPEDISSEEIGAGPKKNAQSHNGVNVTEEQRLLAKLGEDYKKILTQHGEARPDDGIRGQDTIEAENKFRKDHHLGKDADITAALREATKGMGELASSMTTTEGPSGKPAHVVAPEVDTSMRKV
jgi:hypothetical protein